MFKIERYKHKIHNVRNVHYTVMCSYSSLKLGKLGRTLLNYKKRALWAKKVYQLITL